MFFRETKHGIPLEHIYIYKSQSVYPKEKVRIYRNGMIMTCTSFSTTQGLYPRNVGSSRGLRQP